MTKTKIKTIVTSIRMYPELWKRFKIYCLIHDLEVSKELSKMMKEKIGNEKLQYS